MLPSMTNGFCSCDKVRDPDMGRGYPGLSERTLSMVRNTLRERQREIDRGEEGQVAEQNQSKNVYAFGYRDGGRDHEPREAGRKTLETGEDKKSDLPVKLPKGASMVLHTHQFLSSATASGYLSSQKWESKFVLFTTHQFCSSDLLRGK